MIASPCVLSIDGKVLDIGACSFEITEPLHVRVPAPPPVSFSWSGSFKLRRSAWERLLRSMPKPRNRRFKGRGREAFQRRQAHRALLAAASRAARAAEAPA